MHIRDFLNKIWISKWFINGGDCKTREHFNWEMNSIRERVIFVVNNHVFATVFHLMMRVHALKQNSELLESRNLCSPNYVIIIARRTIIYDTKIQRSKDFLEIHLRWPRIAVGLVRITKVCHMFIYIELHESSGSLTWLFGKMRC